VTDFGRLLAALVNAGVEFVVIGGMAATAHGSAHVTVDLDIVYRRTSDNIARLSAALLPLQPYLRGAPPGLPFRFDADTIKRGLNFTLVTLAGDLDVRPLHAPQVQRPERRSRTAAWVISREQTWVISRER
jgi:hypothetical protein